MKRVIIYSLALILGLAGCITPHKITSSWVSPEIPAGVTYQKIFVIALTDDRAAQGTAESSIEARLRESGIDVVKSTDLFPPAFASNDIPDKAEMIRIIRDSGCDAIFTLALLDVLSEERYNPGTPYYIGRPAYGFYRYYYGYYRYRYQVVHTPGYYTTDKTYLVESNLYDTRSERLVWTVQSTSFNPSGFSDWFQGYSETILTQLKNDGLIGNATIKEEQFYGDIHTSMNSVDWSGTYYGILPCASCQGIETELYLGDDRSYKLTSRYLGEQEEPFTKSGTFTLTGNTIKLLGIEDNAGSGLYKLEENRIRLLDMDGNTVTGELEANYVMTKNGNLMAEDKKWILTEINGRSVDEDPAENYMILHSDRNTLEAKAGCNVLLYQYQIRNNYRLVVNPGISTLMACPEGSLEDEFIEVLKKADNITVTKDQLSLNKARMAPLARFRVTES